MSVSEAAYLGPEGTYSHLVAEKRYGRKVRLIPLPTIYDVCAYVARDPSRRGIVPIENSSGGAIYETVDILLANKPPVCVQEELSLDVKLALLGHPRRKIKVLYSHFAPLEHCSTWLRRHLPRIERRVVTSTALAAQKAALEPDAAALGSRRLASLCGLKVLHYPVEPDVPNVTVFIAIGGRERVQPSGTRSTLAAKLPNVPGSLCTFLEAFRNEGVNLSRIVSRPIRGSPREYAFLVDVDGRWGDTPLRKALAAARRSAALLRTIGSYPCRRPYTS